MILRCLNFRNLLIFFMALLPLQLTLRLVLKLPNFLMLIYIFFALALIYFFLTPYKIVSKLQLIIFVILSIFFIEMSISVLYNYPNVLDRIIPVQYYASEYSSFWDSSLMSSLFAGIIRPIIYFLFCFFSFFILNKEKYLKKLCRLLIIIGLISSIYSIYQFVAYYLGLPFDSVFSGHNGEIITFMGIRRCEGILYEPGPQATYLSVIFCLLLTSCFNNFNNGLFFKRKILEIAILILVTITLFLTLSPIGMLTPFIIIPMYIGVNWKNCSKKFKKIIFLFITISILFLLCSGVVKLGNKVSSLHYLVNRITALQPNNNIYWGDHRSVRNEFGLNVIKHHFILGVGAGNDGFYYARYAPYAVGSLPDKGIVINNNIKIFSDSGILGFICYIILLLTPFLYFYKKKLYINKDNYFLYNLSIALFFSEILFVVLTFNSQVEFFQPLFWIVYSMLITTISLLYRNKVISSFLKKNNTILLDKCKGELSVYK